jgi:protein-L-isoaspartate(D-aspartate) O-methyltransferase
MVTAGGPEIPEPLVAQLADPGRLVIPVGEQDHQELRLVTKKDGVIQEEVLEWVRFVNLIGEYGWER